LVLPFQHYKSYVSADHYHSFEAPGEGLSDNKEMNDEIESLR